MPQIEKAIEKIKRENPDFALRVNDSSQKFHETVEQFLQSKRKGYKIIEQIKELLRLSPDEDLEPLHLSTAIDLIDEIAKDLDEFDQNLGVLTRHSIRRAKGATPLAHLQGSVGKGQFSFFNIIFISNQAAITTCHHTVEKLRTLRPLAKSFPSASRNLARMG